MNKWKSIFLKLLVFGAQLFFIHQSLAENYLECERRVGAQQLAECKKLLDSQSFKNCQQNILNDYIKKQCARLPLEKCMDSAYAEAKERSSACGPDSETPEEIQSILKAKQCHNTALTEYDEQRKKVCATDSSNQADCRSKARQKLDSDKAACGPNGTTPEIRGRIEAAKECLKKSRDLAMAAQQKCRSEDPAKACLSKPPKEKTECLDKFAIPPT